MALDYVDVGCSPHAENCAQVGSDDYSTRARKECKALINQLRRMFGPEPGTARLKIKANPHDFGTYHEVICQFSDQDEEAAEYAYKLEDGLPEYWDEEAKAELAKPE